MGTINVEGIGDVEIAGDAPTAEETQAILAASRGGAQPAPERSFGERMLRQAGLGARMLATGATMIPGAIGDAINGVVNVGINGVNAAAGTQIPELGRASEVINRGIDAVTPQPENATERVLQRVGSTLTGVATGGALARAAGAIGPVAQRVADVLTARPISQGIAAGLTAAGGALGREALPDIRAGNNISPADLGDYAGTAIGALAGVGTSAVGGAVPALVAPLTQSGREEMVRRALLRSSSNPATLRDRIASGEREIVPGSPRTTAEVANDPGLLATERTWRGTDPQTGGAFALRDAARTDARRAAVDGMAPRTPPVAAGAAAREGIDFERQRAAAEVNRLYNAIPEDAGAFPAQGLLDAIAPDVQRIYGRATGGVPTELRPILQRIIGAADPPAGAAPSRATMQGIAAEAGPAPAAERLAQARAAGAPSGTFSYGDLRAMAREMGDVAGRAQAQGDRTLATTAGRIRDAIDEMMAAPGGGLTPEQLRAHNTALAARRAMGAAYDEGAVGAATARNQFGRPEMPAERVPGTLTPAMSPTAIRQTEAAIGANPQAREALRGEMVNRLRTAMETTTPGATGETTDSAAAFHRFLRQNEDALRMLYGAQGFNALATVGRDFASRQMVDSVARAAGSNTAQNLSVANVLAEAFGGLIDPRRAATHPLMRALNAPYRWANAEQAIRETMNRALLDPDFAQLLASQATPQTMRAVASRMGGWQRAAGTIGRGIGNTVGPGIPGAAASQARRPAGDYPAAAEE
jgi:hypothetical protein